MGAVSGIEWAYLFAIYVYFLSFEEGFVSAMRFVPLLDQLLTKKMWLVGETGGGVWDDSRVAGSS